MVFLNIEAIEPNDVINPREALLIIQLFSQINYGSNCFICLWKSG